MIVTLKHVGYSWWWHQNKCEVSCSDGRRIDPMKGIPENTGMTYEIHETKDGIEARYFACSSGGGKTESKTFPPKILIHKSEYTKVVHTGKEPDAPNAETIAFVIRETTGK